MDIDINLQRVTTSRSDRFAKVIHIVAIVLLGSVTLLTVVFLVLKNTSSLSRLSQEETDLLARINKQNVKIARFSFIKERIVVGNTYFRDRSDIKGVLSTLRADIPDGVTLSSLSVNKREFSMSLNSSSGDLIHQYVTVFQTKTSKNPMFQSATVETVNFDKKSNRYEVNVKGVLSDSK